MNKALKILLSTNAIILLAAAMLGPIYAIFVEEIGGSHYKCNLWLFFSDYNLKRYKWNATLEADE